ncbi:MAG: DNA mismatch repair endonuclease MutL [Desulfobacteraceae bacterium]|nr:DNA mismatch repair endonuclease MutL [Desulfobacteraceae bacterium]
MADVRILPDILSNKIAAGEVVERPVSVVKELVENALDAGATRIVAEIEKGGRDLIRISDNGSGMSRDNALLAIERYATSKIFTDDDLFAIKTFGFRGEALPSMASVSKFTLTTREHDSDVGTRIHISGGKIMDVSDAGAPPGTMIEVGRLYFNTPARRKFLKGINTEMGHIADAFSGMALGNPHVGFRLMHNNRLVKAFSSPADMKTRAGEVFGMATLPHLCRVAMTQGETGVTGYVSDPSLTRSTSRNLRLFVNNRLITDKGIVAAIFKGYKGRLMKGRYPLGILFITIPFDQVDVNVHPSKLEVRFSDQRQVFGLVVRAVNHALAETERSGSAESPSLGEPEESESESVGESVDDDLPRPVQTASGQRKKAPAVDRSLFQWGKPAGEPVKPKVSELESDLPFPEIEPAEAAIQKVVAKPEFVAPESGKIRQKRGSDPVVVGQVLGTYIVLETDNGMELVDQHAAHERVVYERLKKRSDSYRPPSQTLAVPETLELTYKEADILEQIIPELEAVGMEIEPFGGTAFIVKAVPAIIDDRDIRPLILDIVEKLLESGGDAMADTREWLDECITLMACHTAIRANQVLNLQEMETLIRELEQCENPSHCPHGRPTRIQWGRQEIEKLFKRIV